MPKEFSVYIVSNPKHTVFYTGMTSNLEKRIWQHKKKVTDGFTKKYNCHHLLYYETGGDLEGALQREQQIKRFKKAWKANLISSFNPDWRDLSDDFLD